jgi:hypothetical protein
MELDGRERDGVGVVEKLAVSLPLRTPARPWSLERACWAISTPPDRRPIRARGALLGDGGLRRCLQWLC